LAARSKEEIGAAIQAEKAAYEEQEATDRARVLDDISQGDIKLKKTKTKDKGKLKKKRHYCSNSSRKRC